MSNQSENNGKVIGSMVVLLAAALLLFTGQSANAEIKKEINSVTTSDREMEYKLMNHGFYRRFTNDQYNSLVPESSIANGGLLHRLVFSNRSSASDISDLFVIDEGYGCISAYNYLAIFSLRNGVIIGERSKLNVNHTPVVLRMDGHICFVAKKLYSLTPQNITEKDDRRIGKTPLFSHDWATMTDLFLRERFFIAGKILGPFPKDGQRMKRILSGYSYSGSKPLWSLTFDKTIPPPPVCNLDGNIIIFHNGTLRLIAAKDGSTIVEKTTDREILSSSVGPNGRLYTVARHDLSYYFVEWDEGFNEIGSVEILRLAWNQPPVTLVNGTVLLVATGMVIAYRKQQQLWQYPCLMADTTHPFLATATANNRILLIAGRRLVCLDENGKELWVYTKDDVAPFRIQPVVGKDGAVYVADNRALYVVR